VAEADARRSAVALVGFMGAGKSAVGEQLAAALALPLVDTDELIAAAAGPIAGIFETLGEQGFRALEVEIVLAAVAAAERHPSVLSLGGGAVLSGEVRAALRRLPLVVWLDAPAAVLWSRVLAGGADERPLAGDEEAFSALLAAREPFYREVAVRVVRTDGRSVEEVVEEIVAGIAAKAGAEPAERRGVGSSSPNAEGGRR
jgi:shikimate kinase